MAAYKGKKLSEMHGSERAARIKQLLGNPGTRKYVPTSDLPTGLRAKRDLNTRLATPIVEGSSITGRDLAHQRQAAETLQFGANTVGAFQNREKETAGWYDEFQRRLEQARVNTQAYGEQAQRELAGAGNIQGPALAGAPVDPGNQKDAANAAAIRQALLGGMQGQLTGQARAANDYANQRANVVGPGQKIQALGQARAATDARRQEVGAFRTKFNADTTADESKNVLAKQALGLDITKATTTAQTAADRIAETARHNKVAERNQSASVSARASSGDHYGYTNAEWATMNPAQRRAAAKKWKAETTVPEKGKAGDPAKAYAKDFYSKYGVKPASTAAVGSAKNSITSAQTLVQTIRKADPKMSPQQLGQLLINGQPGSTKKGQESMAIPKTKALWAKVAIELAFNNGIISAGTADRLHRAGYSVKLLGLDTGGPKIAGPKDLPASKK